MEKGITPQTIQAANKELVFSRPLCAYPLVAKYQGTGDSKDAANFGCVRNDMSDMTEVR